MTEEQKKKIDRKLIAIYIGIMVLLVAFMILVGVKGMVNTLVYPIGISIFLAAYWVVSNVLSVIWGKSFEGKTADQKKSYYVCAALDAIGMAGLVHFLVNMTSTTGAIIYVACTVLKRKFRQEFNGTEDKKDDPEEDSREILQEPEEEVQETAQISEAAPAEEQPGGAEISGESAAEKEM